MSDNADFVRVPEKLRERLGSPLKGTRIYDITGSEEGLAPRYELVDLIAGPCVSPGGVMMYAPVTRAAVHKRVKEGKMTAFCYHVSVMRKSLFGQVRPKRKNPYIYVPISECKAWAEEINQRVKRGENITPIEFEGKQPDWIGEFWEWRSNWRKRKFKKLGLKLPE